MRGSRRGRGDNENQNLGPPKPAEVGRSSTPSGQSPVVIVIDDDDHQEEVRREQLRQLLQQQRQFRLLRQQHMDRFLMYLQNRETIQGEMIDMLPHSHATRPRSTVTETDLELRLGSPVSASGARPPSQTITDQVCNNNMIKLKCTICMDTMKDETSTVCGHLFCKVCIINAIRVQSRCPTCRRQLSFDLIHRVYLPATSSSDSSSQAS